MSSKRIVKNVIYGFVGQVFILFLGIIIPRVLIVSYGSDTNGLLSTITQIFTYMALLEAGIASAAKNALYDPVSRNNKQEISRVISIARNYYHRVTLVYGIAVLLMAIVLPYIIKTDIDKVTILLIVLFQGMSGVIGFYFTQTYSIILSTDGKGYVNNVVNVCEKSLNYGIKIVLAYLGVNIVLFQFFSFLFSIIKVVFYSFYMKRAYYWIDYNIDDGEGKLADRNSYVVNELAWTVFSSTDMIILSAFVSTKMSSVYNIYNMVFSAVNVLFNAVYFNLSYVLGQTYHRNKNKYEKVHDMFISVFVGGTTITISTIYLLLIPFIELYTNDVEDVNYIYSNLPILFCLIQILSWSRYVQGNLTGLAGYAKQTSYISLAEAFINFFLSLFLVQKYSIFGVLIATVVALPLKVLYTTYISDKKIIHRSLFCSIKILGVNYLLFLGAVLIGRYIVFNINSYLSLLSNGIVVFCVIFVIGFLLNMIVNPFLFKFFIEVIKRKKHISFENL